MDYETIVPPVGLEIISERQEKVLRYLTEHDIPFTTYNHPEGKTIEEAKRWWKDDSRHGCHLARRFSAVLILRRQQSGIHQNELRYTNGLFVCDILAVLPQKPQIGVSGDANATRRGLGGFV